MSCRAGNRKITLTASIESEVATVSVSPTFGSFAIQVQTIPPSEVVPPTLVFQEGSEPPEVPAVVA